MTNLIYWPIEPPWSPYVVSLFHFEGNNGDTTWPTSSARNTNSMVTTGNFNANLSNAQAKFGSRSMHVFGGGGGGVQTPDNQNSLSWNNSMDWTIEFWVRPDSLGVPQTLYDMRTSSHAAQWSPLIGTLSTQGPGDLAFFANGAAQITATGVLTISVWQSIALCKSKNVIRMFVNGTQVGSDFPDTNDYNQAGTEVCLGCETANFHNSCLGYFDELRVTKGTGWYGANYTPATAAFANQ